MRQTLKNPASVTCGFGLVLLVLYHREGITGRLPWLLRGCAWLKRVQKNRREAKSFTSRR